MSLKIIIPLIAASVAVIAFFFMMGGEEKSTAPKPVARNSEGTSTTAQPSLNTTASTTNKQEASAEAVSTPAPATSLPIEKPQILEHIHEASISYSAEELPKIQPFLTHSDPEIRAAAVQGVIDLGDAAGGPLLRKAAEMAPSQAEADAMRKAADYVELPSASLLKKN